MKHPSLLSILSLFIIGFVLINGYHNMLTVLFVLALIVLFIVIPMLIRVKYFVRDLAHPTSIPKQWA